MGFNGFQISFYAVQIRFDELMSFSVVEVITMIKCFKTQINLVNSFCCKRTAEVDFRLSALPGKATLHLDSLYGIFLEETFLIHQILK